MGTPFDVPLDELRTRRSSKWATYPPDVLPAFVAEMDVRLPEAVVRAVADTLSRGDTGYEVGNGYAEAFAAFAAERYGWQVPVVASRPVPDVMLGIAEVVRVLTAPGDGVVINPPVYPPFREFLAHAGRRVVDAPLGADGRLDLEALDRAFTDATAYLLCHPHNPTGTLHSRDELAAVGELAARHGVRVVADEIHAPLVVGDAPFVPTTTVIPDAVALHSASKGFHLAGLKAAVAVPGPDAAADLARMPEIVGHAVSHVGSVAHQAAFREGGPWLDEVLAVLRENVATTERTLADRLPSARWRRPEATYFAWLDLRDTPAVRATGAEPVHLLREEGRLATQPGPAFGPGGEGRVRLNLACSPQTLTEVLDRLTTTLA
ncbi:aminotransferase class I/II-fold pyridoxal phosphate-dependent enzyme [Cellulomonas sp.]|uniref:MalY/PatB family protein n=1 Tax=Cellulomonas sp. TaxID=40001 RepID=UPI0028119046|nr:aminotransferase class I/II-fold pyridoxal phosphate-dependent enzyme [Cellulomonas sp.]